MPNGTATAQADMAKQMYGTIAGNRWVQLFAGVIAMIVISNYQYAFTLFTPGMRQQFTGVPYAKIAGIFSMFILFETWPVPVAGYFVDKFGIRKLMMIGSLAILVGWLLGGMVATSVFELYIYYGAIAGTGAGIIYISTVANAVKWFPDRRGLAAGLTAAGFGGGAALTIIPIAGTISSMGWGGAMAMWGVAQGIIAFIMALILRHPPAGWAPPGWAERSKLRNQGCCSIKGELYLDSNPDEARVLSSVHHVPFCRHGRPDDDRKPLPDCQVSQCVRYENMGFCNRSLYGYADRGHERLLQDHVGFDLRQTGPGIYDDPCLCGRGVPHLPDDPNPR